MSSMSVTNAGKRVNPQLPQRRNFDRYANVTPEDIPGLWRELTTLASLVPSGQVAGIHRLRTRLLVLIPKWRLPDVLDALALEGDRL